MVSDRLTPHTSGRRSHRSRGLIASEAIWADPTLDLEPIVDGLSVDEALLGGVIGGVIADIATRFSTHAWPFTRRSPA